MNFLVDAQLPPALARALSEAGFPASHVNDLGLSGAPDHAIWSIACERGFRMMTKDADFAFFLSSAPPHTPVVWLRFGNLPKALLIARVLPRMDQVMALLSRGDMLVEVR